MRVIIGSIQHPHDGFIVGSVVGSIFIITHFDCEHTLHVQSLN